jgi:hypothetical protein
MVSAGHCEWGAALSATYASNAARGLNGFLRTAPYASVVVKNAGTETVHATAMADALGNWEVTITASGKYDIVETATTGETKTRRNLWIPVDDGGGAIVEELIASRGLIDGLGINQHWFASGPAKAAESDARVPLPRAGTFTRLDVKLSEAPGTGETVFVVPVINGSPDFGLDLTISHPSTSGFVTGSAANTAGQTFSWRSVSSRSVPARVIAGGQSQKSGGSGDHTNHNVTVPTTDVGTMLVMGVAALASTPDPRLLFPKLVDNASAATGRFEEVWRLMTQDGSNYLGVSLWWHIGATKGTLQTVNVTFGATPRTAALSSCSVIRNVWPQAPVAYTRASNNAASLSYAITNPVDYALAVEVVAGRGSNALTATASQTQVLASNDGTALRLSLAVKFLTVKGASETLSWTMSGSTQMAAVTSLFQAQPRLLGVEVTGRYEGA